MSAIRNALQREGIPIDPRQCEHHQHFWYIAPADAKWCLHCHERKPLDQFDRNSQGREGRLSYCKTCRRTYQNNWRRQRKAA